MSKKEFPAVLKRKAYMVGHKEDMRDIMRGLLNTEGIEVMPDKGERQARMNYRSLYTDTPYHELRARRTPHEDIYLFEGKEKKRYVIESILKYREWREMMEKLVCDNLGRQVRIYSGEHMQYWMPGYCGYTCDIRYAGIYDINEAWGRVMHCGAEKQITFELI